MTENSCTLPPPSGGAAENTAPVAAPLDTALRLAAAAADAPDTTVKSAAEPPRSAAALSPAAVASVAAAPSEAPASVAPATRRAPRLASRLVLAGLATQAAPPVRPAVAQHLMLTAEALAGAPVVAPARRDGTREAPAAEPAATFTNPIARGADPWVVRHGRRFFFCEPVRDSAIAVWQSDRLTTRGTRHIVWRAPRAGWNSHLIWAPELHRLDGRWHIYYGASAAPRDNASHRVGVLESAADDPLGPYVEHGPLYTGDDTTGRRANRWAIDATVLELGPRRYLVWSGWPARQDEQYLYIAPLLNPWTTAGRRVRLCDNATYDWERVNDDPRQRGLHEGPQVLQRGGRTFIVYSCSSSWQPTYKLGLLELVGEHDPLNPRCWRKHPEPVFQSSAEVFGVGHAAFVRSGDQDWIVYHAKQSRAAGWERVVCVQRFGWHADGRPNFGQPVPWGVPLAAPRSGA